MLSYDDDLHEIKAVYNHTCFATYLHLRVGNVGGECSYWLLGETNATLLGVFQVTLFCSGPRRIDLN